MTRKKHPVLTAFAVIFAAGMILTAAFWFAVHLSGRDGLWSRSDRIGVITLEGPIADSRTVVSQMVDFRKDKRIKAIVLRINSPGGAVGPTQEIYREIRKTVQVKPVVASVEAVAASGGYYAASAATRIFANPGSITGSIGALIEIIRVEDLLAKLGISLEVVKSGDYKDIGSPHRKLTDRERELLNELLRDIQNQFVKEVAEARNLPEEHIEKIADGRIFSGARAKEFGLVDELGNFQDAVDAAGLLGDVDGEPELVYPRPERLNLWRLFGEHIAGALLDATRSGGTRLEYRWNGCDP
ncbi:MAG TPA: signal peptide peptidase SppA [Desulfobacteraceae bacterium]|jgi:protease IV|nr:signal peptide peptidase SppA [Desulfobacteraceae bacterium]